MRAATDLLLSPSRISMSFHSCAESCIASATCAAVTIKRGERNQPVPRIPTTPGCALISSSLKYLAMLMVEWTNGEGTRHAASTREQATTSTKTENNDRRMMPPGSHVVRTWIDLQRTREDPETRKLAARRGRDCDQGATTGENFVTQFHPDAASRI